MSSQEEQWMDAAGCGLLKFRREKDSDDFFCEYANEEAERILGMAQGMLWSRLSAGYILSVDSGDEVLKFPDGKAYRVIKKKTDGDGYLFTLLDKSCEDRMDKEMGDFLFTASHDLQEPLRKITSFGERIKRNQQLLGEENSLYLSRMMNATGRMQDMLAGLLSFSRIGIDADANTECDMSEVLRLSYQEASEVAGKPNAVFRSQELPSIQADKSQMVRLFREVFGNALKFQEMNTTPEISVVSDVDPSSNRVKISVTDNGIGFDNEHAERIFKLFYRLNGRAEYEGAGIGLAICKKIVETHAGEITARSVPGKGTTIEIMLPLIQLRR